MQMRVKKPEARIQNPELPASGFWILASEFLELN
jgi:hypothetical protein